MRWTPLCTNKHKERRHKIVTTQKTKTMSNTDPTKKIGLQFKHYSSKHNHNMHCIILITDKWRVFDIVPPYNFPMFPVKSRSFCKHINSFANYKTYLAIIIRRFGLFVPKI